ncbi:hypothetical protein ISN39_12220 [Rhizobium sp. 007]|nr:hypothetical protein ISN39_12220 [Rhizobium sp. 007]
MASSSKTSSWMVRKAWIGAAMAVGDAALKRLFYPPTNEKGGLHPASSICCLDALR